jgi:hypothetical protein
LVPSPTKNAQWCRPKGKVSGSKAGCLEPYCRFIVDGSHRGISGLYINVNLAVRMVARRAEPEVGERMRHILDSWCWTRCDDHQCADPAAHKKRSGGHRNPTSLHATVAPVSTPAARHLATQASNAGRISATDIAPMRAACSLAWLCSWPAALAVATAVSTARSSNVQYCGQILVAAPT